MKEKSIDKKWAISKEDEQKRRQNVEKMLVSCIEKKDSKLSLKELVEKYNQELENLCKYDKDLVDNFGFANCWWVFGRVAKELNYKIFMAEVENVGYKRTKRGSKPMPNELYRENENGEILLDDEVLETALDYLRQIKWD